MSSKMWYPLFEAAAKDDYLRVEELAEEEDVNLDVQDARGRTALIIAAYKGSDFAVQTLVRLGADVNKQDLTGMTALHYAVCRDDYLVVGELNSMGKLDLNIQDDNGWAALHWATFKDSPRMVELLANLGANLVISNKEGETPIDLIAPNTKEVVMKIIQAAHKSGRLIAKKNDDLN